MSAQTLQKGYQQKVTNLISEVRRLSAVADEVAKKRAASIQAQKQMNTSREQVAFLTSERTALMQDYQLASWEGDEAAMQEVLTRKSDIDEQLESLEAGIAELAEVVESNFVNIEESTAVAVEIDTLDVPDVLGYVKALEKILRAEANDLSDKKQMARGKLPINVDIYNDLMHEVRPWHKSSAQLAQDKWERERREAEDAATYARLTRV